VVGVVIFVFVLLFVVVVALFAGNTSNLASVRRLSTIILQQLKKKFSLFSRQASNPYSHNGNPRLHDRQTIGKNFAANVNFGRRPAGRKRTEMNQCVNASMRQCGKNLLHQSTNILNKRQLMPFTRQTFQGFFSEKNSITTRPEKCQAKNHGEAKFLL
jgi:hypothetical protein